MSLEYINIKDQKYYLHRNITKRGNFRYYFSKKCDNNVIDKIPDGYEIYENPSAQVFLRKINISSVSREDTSIVENVLYEKTDFDHYYLDVHTNEITVYLPNLDIEELEGMLSITMVGDNIELGEFSAENFTYVPSFKVMIESGIDDTEKTYILEKYEVEGDLKRWNHLGSSIDLKKLLETSINEFLDKSYSKLKILFS